MHSLTTLETAAGWILLFVLFIAILAMLAVSYKLVAESAIKEAKQEAEHKAQILAERKYQRMLATTRYRVRIGMRIVDEMEVPK